MCHHGERERERERERIGDEYIGLRCIYKSLGYVWNRGSWVEGKEEDDHSILKSPSKYGVRKNMKEDQI